MLRIKDQVRLWTRNEVADLIADALTIVDEVGPDNDLREAAFVQACGLLAQKHATIEEVGIGVSAMHVPRTGP